MERGGKVNDVSVGIAVVAGDPNPLSSKKVDEICARGDCEEEPKSAKSPKSSSSNGAFAGTLDGVREASEVGSDGGLCTAVAADIGRM